MIPRTLLTFSLRTFALLASAALASALTVTPTTTEGPYYTMSSANQADKTHFTGEGLDNDLTHITSTSTQCTTTSTSPLFLLSGTLVNTAGTAIAGATIELWEADSGGIYWYTSSSSTTNAYASRDKNFQGYGTCVTDSSGNWSFRTIKPGLYTGRIRHFHFKVRLSGTEYLTSQFMFAEDSASFSSDGVASLLVSAGTMSLVTLTPTSGTDSSGNSALIASKQIVINYTPTTTGSAPTITTSPTSLSVAAGSSATFTVVATSSTTATYQWYKGSFAISGATSSSYTISAVTTSDAGSYSVVVTNSAGSTTSATATLTVTTTGSAPTITVNPLPAALGVGDSVTFSVTATSATTPTYQWLKDGTAITGAIAATYTIASALTSDAGAYSVKITNSAGTATSTAAALLVTAATNSTSYLVNLSARATVPSGGTLIAGFVVESTNGKRLLIRAVGPTLTSLGVSGAMTDPSLKVYDSSGTAIAANDNWDSSLASTFSAVGAFALTSGSKDSAVVLTLPGSLGTAHVTGNSAGIALVETYDVDGASASSRLVNLSARSPVGTGDSVLIAGFVVGGTGGKRLLIRGVGPKLTALGVTGALSDPKLTLYNSSNVELAENDDWSSSLASTFTTLGAFALDSGSKDAALLVTLPAGGAYSAIVSGVSSTTGEAMVEIYEVP